MMGDGTFNGLMKVFVGGVYAGALAGVALGQGSTGSSFPIRAVSEPVWPADMGMDALPWDAGLGTLDTVGDLNGDGVDDLVVLWLEGDNRLPSDRSMWVYFGERLEDGQVTFGTPEKIAGFGLEGSLISDMSIHDHNGDGLNDLVLITDLAHSVEVWLNTGGDFVVGETLKYGLDDFTTGQKLLIEDVDRDGDEDYLIMNCCSSVVWSNLGGGVYGHEELPIAMSKGQFDFGLSDADGDGDLDILVIQYYGEEIEVLEQMEDGWAAESDVRNLLRAENFEYWGTGLCFADVNGDGDSDLVVFASGNFGDDSNKALGIFLSPLSESETQTVPVMNFPDMNNRVSADLLFPFRQQPFMLRSPGDLDGDGTDDLLFFGFDNQEYGWRITDPLGLNGRQAVYSEYDIHGEGAIDQPLERDYDRFTYRDVYSDLNGDGVKDRVVPTYAERFVYLYGEGGEPVGMSAQSSVGLGLWSVVANPGKRDAVFSEQDAIYAPGNMSHLVAADIDEDGDQEIVTLRDGGVKFVYQDLDGLYRYDEYTRSFSSGLGFRLVVESIDNDPRLDVLSLRLGSNEVSPFGFYNPDLGGFEGLVRNTDNIVPQELGGLLPASVVSFASVDNSFTINDVNGDGTKDIVIRGNIELTDGYIGEAVLVWPNDGTGLFSAGPISPIGSLGTLDSTRTYNMESDDINRDGIMDIVCVESDVDGAGYFLSVYLNDGSGSFTLGQQMSIHSPFNTEPYWIAIEDVDGDSIQDVVVLLKNDSDFHEAILCYGAESGLESTAHRWAGGNAAELVIFDLDGDGMKDVLSCAYQDNDEELKNSISIMFQSEPRVFGPIVSIPEFDYQGINTADLDSDGGVDLISCTNELVRVHYGIDEMCEADMNFDGQLDFFDVALFVRLLIEQREFADLNRDGSFDFFDVTRFLSAYSAGFGL